MKSLLLLIITVSLTFGAIGCTEAADEAAVAELTAAGFDPEAAGELAGKDLSPNEIDELALAAQGGVDGAAAVAIVDRYHDRDLTFDIGQELQLLSGAGFSPTGMVRLVEIGALPEWEAEIRELKTAGVGESTVLTIAELKFKRGKELLSAGEYASLKQVGISDVGLERFVQEDGSRQDLQQLRIMLAQGTSEQAALKQLGL